MKEPRTQLVLWMPAGEMDVRREKTRKEVVLALAEIILAAAVAAEGAGREVYDETR